MRDSFLYPPDNVKFYEDVDAVLERLGTQNNPIYEEMSNSEDTQIMVVGLGKSYALLVKVKNDKDAYSIFMIEGENPVQIIDYIETGPIEIHPELYEDSIKTLWEVDKEIKGGG